MSDVQTEAPPTLWFARMPFNHPDHRNTKPKVHIFAHRGTTSMNLLVALCGYEVLEYESSNPSQPLKKTAPPVADRCALCVAKHNGTSSGPRVRTPKRPAHKPRSTAVDASIAKRRAKEPSKPRVGEFRPVTAGMLFDVLEQIINVHGADAPIHVVGRTPEHHPLEGDPATMGYAMPIAQISDTAKGSLVIRVDTRTLQQPEPSSSEGGDRG